MIYFPYWHCMKNTPRILRDIDTMVWDTAEVFHSRVYELLWEFSARVTRHLNQPGRMFDWNSEEGQPSATLILYSQFSIDQIRWRIERKRVLVAEILEENDIMTQCERLGIVFLLHSETDASLALPWCIDATPVKVSIIPLIRILSSLSTPDWWHIDTQDIFVDIFNQHDTRVRVCVRIPRLRKTILFSDQSGMLSIAQGWIKNIHDSDMDNTGTQVSINDVESVRKHLLTQDRMEREPYVIPSKDALPFSISFIDPKVILTDISRFAERWGGNIAAFGIKSIWYDTKVTLSCGAHVSWKKYLYGAATFYGLKGKGRRFLRGVFRRLQEEILEHFPQEILPNSPEPRWVQTDVYETDGHTIIPQWADFPVYTSTQDVWKSWDIPPVSTRQKWLLSTFNSMYFWDTEKVKKDLYVFAEALGKNVLCLPSSNIIIKVTLPNGYSISLGQYLVYAGKALWWEWCHPYSEVLQTLMRIAHIEQPTIVHKPSRKKAPKVKQ